MAANPRLPVVDRGKRVKNLTKRETTRGLVFERWVYLGGKKYRRPVGPPGMSQEEAVRIVKRTETLEGAAKLDGLSIHRTMRLGEVAQTYFDLTEEYIERAKLLGPDLTYRGVRSSLTLDTYRANWRKYIEPFFKSQTLVNEITTPRVSAFFRWLRSKPGAPIKLADGTVGTTTLAESTVNSIRSTLSVILGEARNQGAMTTNPLSALPPRDRPRPLVRPSYVKTTVRKDDLLRMVAAAPEGYKRALVTTAVLTGMRASEVVGLIWSDVRLDDGHIYLTGSIGRPRRGEPIQRETTKTGKSRKIALLPQVIAALKAHRAIEWQKGLGREDDFVFSSVEPEYHGRPVTRQTLLREVREAGRQAGIETIDNRAVRRSVATWLANSEMPHHTAASMMGHSVDTFREVYVQNHDDRTETDMIVTAMQEARNA